MMTQSMIFHGMVRRGAEEGLEVDVGVPGSALDERVGGRRELGSGCVDGTELAAERRRCLLHLGRDGVGLHYVLELHQRRIGPLRVGRIHCPTPPSYSAAVLSRGMRPQDRKSRRPP